MLRIIVAIVIGTLVGMIGGTLGLAGTTLMLPLLLLSNIIPNYRTLIGTMLFSILPPISLLAVIEYGKRKEIDYLIGTLLFIAYFFGAYYGSIVNTYFSDKTLMYTSSVVMFVVSLLLFYAGYTRKA